MSYFFQLLMSGIMVGSIYSLVALGFVVLYKSSGIVNFAQGQFLAIGAIILWTLWVSLGLPLWLAGLLSVICSMFLGMVIEYLTIRPMTGQPLMAVIVMTIGLSVLLESLMFALFPGLEEAYPQIFPSGGMQILEVSISYEHLASFITALGMLCIFVYFFHRTKLGLCMRGVADGHDTARSCGIQVGKIFRWSWAIAAASAMIGGFLMGSRQGVSPDIASIAIKVFPVLILGGLDSIVGCIVAGPIVGILEALAA